MKIYKLEEKGRYKNDDGEELILVGTFHGKELDKLLVEAEKRGMEEDFWSSPIFPNTFSLKVKDFKRFNAEQNVLNAPEIT